MTETQNAPRRGRPPRNPVPPPEVKEEAPKSLEWQSMDTAPTDGEPIRLTWNRRDAVIARWRKTRAMVDGRWHPGGYWQTMLGAQVKWEPVAWANISGADNG